MAEVPRSGPTHSNRYGQGSEVWSPPMNTSIAVPTKGLLNAPGENNCFLNSAVQVLWHLDAFRRNFRQLTGHACMGNSCIFCALKVIFTNFQFSDQSALPPDALRKALAETFQNQQRFQLGYMDDAAECFENILTRIHYHIAEKEKEDMCNANHCISHKTFAMTVVEQAECKCGATTEPLPFTQMVHYVSTSALAYQARKILSDGAVRSDKLPEMFSMILRNAVSEGDLRDCPSNCGERIQIRRNLMNSPDVVSLGFIWDSARPPSDHIAEVNRLIGESIILSEVFFSANATDTECMLQLVGIVCYYGKHYSTFFFHTKRKIWIYFDDATVKEIGPYLSRVVDKMCRGRYQPLLLMYAKPQPAVLDMRTAPRTTTRVSDHHKFSPPGGKSNEPGNHSHGHSRSRSGGRSGPHRRGGDKVISPDTLRRAITPNPDTRKQRDDVDLAPRRAITPNPEWSGYNSEEEVLNKPAADHRRQSSYLLAVTGTNQEDGKPEPPATDGESGYSSYDQYTGNPDLYGLKMDYHQEIRVPDQTRDLQMTPSRGRRSESKSTKPEDNEIDDYTLSTHGQYRRPTNVPISPNSPTYFKAPLYGKAGDNPNKDGSWRGKNKIGADVVRYQVGNSAFSDFKDGEDLKPPVYTDGSEWNGFDFNRDSSSSERESTLPEHIVVGHVPSPVKRAVSVDERLGSDKIKQLEKMSRQQQKKRPSSARDRGKKIGDEDMGYGSLPRKSGRHATISNPYVPAQPYSGQEKQARGGWKDDGRPTDQKLHAMSSMNHVGNQYKPSLSRHLSESKINKGYEVEEEQGDYISRKTVENILNFQMMHRQQSAPSGISMQNPHNISAVPSKSQTPVKPPVPLKPQVASKPPLKLEIPDNISRDSGFSGDRNSASSASSTSADSPGIDSKMMVHHYGTQPSRNLKSQEQPVTDHIISAITPTVTSMQVKSGRNLTQVPENIATLQTTKATAFFKEKLRETSKHGKPEAHVSSTTRKGPMKTPPTDEVDGEYGMKMGNRTPDEQCEMLYCKAEGLINLSMEKENNGDLHMAMCHCTQASTILKQAMSIPGIGQQAFIYAQVKHNTCVMRSRSLHKRITLRQNSNHSTGSEVSSEDHVSVSSLSTDPDIREQDLSSLESKPDYIGTLPERQVSITRNSSLAGSDSGHSQISVDSGVSKHSSNSTDSRKNMKFPERQVSAPTGYFGGPPQYKQSLNTSFQENMPVVDANEFNRMSELIWQQENLAKQGNFSQGKQTQLQQLQKQSEENLAKFKRSVSVSDSHPMSQYNKMPMKHSQSHGQIKQIPESERGIVLYGTLPKKNKGKGNNTQGGSIQETDAYPRNLNKQNYLNTGVTEPMGRMSLNEHVPSSVPNSPAPSRTLRSSKMSKEDIRKLLHRNMVEKQQYSDHSRQSSTCSRASESSCRTLTSMDGREYTNSYPDSGPTGLLQSYQQQSFPEKNKTTRVAASNSEMHPQSHGSSLARGDQKKYGDESHYAVPKGIPPQPDVTMKGPTHRGHTAAPSNISTCTDGRNRHNSSHGTAEHSSSTSKTPLMDYLNGNNRRTPGSQNFEDIGKQQESSSLEFVTDYYNSNRGRHYSGEQKKVDAMDDWVVVPEQRTNTSSAKSDIAKTKSDMPNIKTDMANAKSDMAYAKSDVDNSKSDTKHILHKQSNTSQAGIVGKSETKPTQSNNLPKKRSKTKPPVPVRKTSLIGSVANKVEEQKKKDMKKSVTFSDSVVLIADANEAPKQDAENYENFMKFLNQTLQRQGANQGHNGDGDFHDSEVPVQNGDPDAEYMSDSFESLDMLDVNKSCSLCGKRQSNGENMYCHHCSYYMAQFNPQPS